MLEGKHVFIIADFDTNGLIYRHASDGIMALISTYKEGFEWNVVPDMKSQNHISMFNDMVIIWNSYAPLPQQCKSLNTFNEDMLISKLKRFLVYLFIAFIRVFVKFTDLSTMAKPICTLVCHYLSQYLFGMGGTCICLFWNCVYRNRSMLSSELHLMSKKGNSISVSKREVSDVLFSTRSEKVNNTM